MEKQFFILGHSPEISRAEIKSLFPKFSENYREFFYPPVLILEMKNTENIIKLMAKLGGTIKMGIIKDEVYYQETSISNLISKILTVSNLLQKYFRQIEERINFGFSFYPLDLPVTKSVFKSLQKLGLKIKKDLKERGYSTRFVTSKEKTLSSVVVGKNSLIERGADICILLSKNKIYIGKTLAIQDYKQFIRRDYTRPGRDAKSGMLPPKLARIMVNLSQAKPDDLLLDPFCGSGTVLQEALLLGIKQVIGSDVSPKAIQDTKSNLKWLTNNFQLPISNFQLIHSDIRNLPNELKERVDVIVTEPFLGPPLRGNESLDRIKMISQELSELYLESFQVFNQILKKNGPASPKPSLGGRIVIVFPIFKKNNQEIVISIIPKIEKMGFQIQKNLSSNTRGSIVYSRSDQRILREIFIFRKSF